jgi:hypothetical protein
MAAELEPNRAIVPIVRHTLDNPISELLGTGFFVGSEDVIHLITAKHVFEGSVLNKGEQYALVFYSDGNGIGITPITSIRAADKFDIAVCAFKKPQLPFAVSLPIVTANPPLNQDVFSFEYSTTRIEKTATGVHVFFEPNSHKGNIVRSYISTFPEKIATASFLTSYPALQGASGAPVIVGSQDKKRFAVAGMLVANVESHLLPAQVVNIEDGPSYRETTSYFLPYGKALSWSVLAECLLGMAVPFEQVNIIGA